VYVVANTEAFQDTVAKELFPLYVTPDGGQGAERGEMRIKTYYMCSFKFSNFSSIALKTNTMK